MSTFFTICYYTLALAALALGVLLLLMQTDMLPGYDVRIVQSGSMEPAISTGSVVIIQDREQYSVGDVITFRDGGNGALPTTHRIIGDQLIDGELVYETKGDANDSADLEPVTPDEVVGVVIFTIPFLGFLLDFARQPLGFALLIGIPALFILVEEIGNIYQALRGRKDDEAESETDDDTQPADTPKEPKPFDTNA